MTLLVAYVGKREAYLAADSAGTNVIDGCMSEVTKVIPLSLASSVIAVRGPTALLTELFHNNQTSGNGFEDVRAKTDSGLVEWFGDALKGGGFDTNAHQEAEVVLVGWCRERKIMRGVIWYGSQSDGFRSEEFNGWRTRPPVSNKIAKSTSKLEFLRKLAAQQVAYIRQHHAGVFVGGRLLVARVEQDVISIHTLKIA